MEETAYANLNRLWKATCKIILGEDVGELSDYRKWLSENLEQLSLKKSSISGKEVAFCVQNHQKGAMLVSLDEVDFFRKYEPLGINEVKDIETLIEKARERAQYCGDIVLGNSSFVSRSANITNSHFVLGSSSIEDSQYIAYSSIVKEASNLFGCNNVAQDEFMIYCAGARWVKRSLEAFGTTNCSDCYYVYGCDGCTDCIFSFNLRNKRNTIGNLELPKEKYSSLKKSLIEQMREILKVKKSLPSLFELVEKEYPENPLTRKAFESIRVECKEKEKAGNKKVINEAFGKTSEIILGKNLLDVDVYGKWLSRNVRKIDIHASIVSGKKVVRGDFLPYSRIPQGRMVTTEEALCTGRVLSIEKEEIENLNFENAKKAIGKLALFNPEIRIGENDNVIDVGIALNSQNCYCGALSSETKNSAFSFWCRKSENIFGCNILPQSTFCLKCYYSDYLARCFEVDSSNNCTGSYFLHNCENVHDSMFCFNVKNLRYAIGNAEVGREKFMQAKEKLQKYILERLEKNKDLKLDIYNLGQ